MPGETVGKLKAMEDSIDRGFEGLLQAKRAQWKGGKSKATIAPKEQVGMAGQDQQMVGRTTSEVSSKYQKYKTKE